MNSSNRTPLTVVRLVAAGFFIVGAMNLGLYWFQIHHNHLEFSAWSALLKSIPILIGIAILFKSSMLAEMLDEYLDND